MENVGSSLILISAIDAHAENKAMEFHRSIANQITNAQLSRAKLIRDVITERIASAQRSSIKLSEQTDVAAKEIANINSLSEDLRREIEREQAGLAVAVNSKDEERASRLQGQLSSKMTSLANLTIERARLTQSLVTLLQQQDTQSGLLAQSRFQEKMLSEPRASLPSLSTSMKDTPRRVRLLFVAFTVSILIAFGTIVFVQRATETRN